MALLKRQKQQWTLALTLFGAVLLASACNRERADERPRIDLTGAGATFPFPLYRQWFADYATRTNVRINYLSVGSREGMRLLDAGEVDFGATDSPDSPVRGAPSVCGPVAVPTVAGAIAIVYQLPSFTGSLRLDRDALADIFSGRVTRWNAPTIAALNPGIKLPATPIVVVHRAAGSGTSIAFERWLAQSSHWRRRAEPRTGVDAPWPVGIAAEGNEGAAAQVKQTIGGIGYVELSYAQLNRLQTAALRNSAGVFVSPSLASLNAALAGAYRPDSFMAALSLADSPAADAYPLGTFTWMAVSPGRAGGEKGRKVVEFLRWALKDGADAARSLEYAPLPPALVTHYDSILKQLSFTPCQSDPNVRPR